MTGSVSSYTTRIAGDREGGGDQTWVTQERMKRRNRMTKYA